MSLILHYNDAYSESRAVLLVCKALNIDLMLEEILDTNGDVTCSKFSKAMPNDCISITPVLKDDDLIIWENHAIITYLINQYRNDDPLYPNDPRKRSLIDEMLHFDSSVLLTRVNNVFNSILIKDEKEISIDKIHCLHEAYNYLEKLLGKTDYLTGDILTVADLCCLATISSGTIITPLSSEKYPKLFQWYSKCRKLPYYTDVCNKGLERLDSLIESKLGGVNSKKSF